MTFQSCILAWYEHKRTFLKMCDSRYDTRYLPKTVLTRFIEVYRQHPALWKVKSKDYTNKYLKNLGYDALVTVCKAVEPNANRDFVSKKIQSIRGSFRKELRKLEQSRSSGEMYVPSLWYFDLLQFTQNIDLLSDENGEEDNNEAVIIFNQGKAEQSTSQDTTYIGEFGDEETTRGSFDYECNEPDFISDDPLAIEVSADGVDTDPKRNPPPIRPQAKKKRGHKIDMGLINETILRLDKITTKVEKEQAGPDDFEAFGRFIVTSLKRMDPECALEAQSEIRRIVEEALKEIASEDVDEEGTISKMTEDSLHENETPIATSTLDLSRMDEEDGMIQNDSDRTTCSSVLRRKPNEDISMEESSSKDNMDEGPSNKRGETDVAFATARSDKRRRLTSRSEILNHVMSKVDYVMDKVKYGTDTDDYELLGRYVSASLRKMPMQLALRVENDIYSIVIKHKMQSVKKHSKIT